MVFVRNSNQLQKDLYFTNTHGQTLKRLQLEPTTPKLLFGFINQCVQYVLKNIKFPQLPISHRTEPSTVILFPKSSSCTGKEEDQTARFTVSCLCWLQGQGNTPLCSLPRDVDAAPHYSFVDTMEMLLCPCRRITTCRNTGAPPSLDGFVVLQNIRTGVLNKAQTPLAAIPSLAETR